MALLLQKKPCVGCGYRCFTANCMKGVKMPLKLNAPKINDLLANNSYNVQADAEVPFNTTEYFALCEVLADVFDSIANGADMYVILGATSKRDAFTCTIKENGAPTTLYGTSLEDLAAKLSSILDNPSPSGTDSRSKGK